MAVIQQYRLRCDILDYFIQENDLGNESEELQESKMTEFSKKLEHSLKGRLERETCLVWLVGELTSPTAENFADKWNHKKGY